MSMKTAKKLAEQIARTECKETKKRLRKEWFAAIYAALRG